MKPTILFFGDSYANCGYSAKGLHQNDHLAYPVYEDILTGYLDMDQLIFGYGGVSWWYSRCKMIDYLTNNLDQLGRVEVVVAMHTNRDRINSCRTIKSSHTETYYKLDAYDQRFHAWAQKKWFQEFGQIFRGKKIINLFCYALSDDSPDTARMTDLTGVIIQQPMIHITVGEFSGTRAETDAFLESSNDVPGNPRPHHNHMNAQNHEVLANQLLGLITDYQPGIVNLDLDMFDMPNKNSTSWPDGKYWTKN